MTLTERQVMAALKTRHPAPAWAFLEQVRNSTGVATVTRTADAMAMSLYPSRGLELHGFEVKVSRGDWLREMKEPSKAEELCRFVDRWWLVVGDASIVRPDELPSTWGLLVPRGSGLHAKVVAPKLEPQPMSRRFLAALLRNVHGYYTTPAVLEGMAQARVEEAVADARRRWDLESSTSGNGLRRRVTELEESISAFQAASGLSIERWTAGQMGEVVKLVLAVGADQVVRRLEYMHQELNNLAEKFGTTLSSVQKTGDDSRKDGKA